MAFESTIKIRFGHEDHARIVYYPRFFDYFHQAFEDFFEAHGRTYRQVLTEDKLGWPAVHAEADFRAPLRFGDELRLEVTVEHVGDKSVRFRYRGLRAADDELVVVGKTAVVCVDMDTFESKPIPEFYRNLFEKHRITDA